MINDRLTLLGLVLSVLAGLPVVLQADITTTKHNLSVTGPGPIKAASETQICIFCHTPHQARRDIPYLWNREDSTANYDTYESSTLVASVGQPTGASKLCLSCHDGTIALGAVLSRTDEIIFSGGIRFIPDGPTRLGTDLSDDHPISFEYDEGLAAIHGELRSPSALVGPVQLDGDGMLQCTACHDPHDDPLNNKFLVATTQRSELCLYCHDPNGWVGSIHEVSGKTWNGVTPDPWPHTEWTTVSDNACENCHRPHSAGGHARLLNYAAEEDNCLTCHNGNVSSKDIDTELTKPYTHPVDTYIGLHEAGEDFETSSVPDHVECMDCHNPHQITPRGANAPDVPGPLTGVTGINTDGMQVPEAAYEYEICYKCHADNNVVNFLEIARQLPQANTRLEFDLANPSYHPVEGIGANPDVPSLRLPYRPTSIIYCKDCHNNSDQAPRGPHGSSFPYILRLNYETRDPNVESPDAYRLCYDCHARESLLNDESGFPHNEHVVGENSSCSVCHDPHGVSGTQANPLNHTHLINFDVSSVSPNSQGLLMFTDEGRFRGSCSLSCHGVQHVEFRYP